MIHRNKEHTMYYPHDMTPADIEAFELEYAEIILREEELEVNKELQMLAHEQSEREAQRWERRQMDYDCRMV